jgi:hypothetical protein
VSIQLIDEYIEAPKISLLAGVVTKVRSEAILIPQQWDISVYLFLEKI